MVRASKKNEKTATEPPNPEAEERKRLKKLAFSKNLLSQAPAKSSSTLNPSKTIIKHHGRDIVKKSQRKNRFLFSFPGLIAPITGGKIGELKDLGTKNPILYVDFPQGQVKLFGTIVYPKNRYLTIQFSKGGKNVMCEDYFDNMIVFSEAWWIGRKDENPEEVRLEFPKELIEEKHVDYDFKGGAGAACEEKSGANKPREEKAKPQSPEVTPEDDISDDSCPSTGKNLKDLMEVTPVRHSARTSGKRFNFAEASSGDDSSGSGADISEMKGKRTEDFSFLVGATDKDLPEKDQRSSFSVCKSKKESLSSSGQLVQATIASLFKKVEVKKSTGSVRKSSTSKVSGQKSREIDLKRKTDQIGDEGPIKKGTTIKEKKAAKAMFHNFASTLGSWNLRHAQCHS
ncbi:hypothetical protein BVC80_8563g4 [Macleaya cordata]|uniref:DNA-binding protein RHL1 n=1 Tax=Macleaya cordata TaxID=56857 RepID=A0A200QIK2_MACCD|nr:hypothetical protein BVC80_8563g4 [Macleaya cordata]